MIDSNRAPFEPHLPRSDPRARREPANHSDVDQKEKTKKGQSKSDGAFFAAWNLEREREHGEIMV